MAYSLTSGGSLSSSVATTLNVAQIKRYSWTCPTSGTYVWSSSASGSGSSSDVYGWVSTTSSDYSTSATARPSGSNSIVTNDDGGGNSQFSCAFQATAGTTYYLYVSPYSSTTNTTGYTFTLKIEQIYWIFKDQYNFLSNGLSFTTTLFGQTIHRYSFIPPASGTYVFKASNCNVDTVGWISDSGTAYLLNQSSNSRNQGTWSDDDSGGNNQFQVTATLNGGTTYYLYFSPYATYSLPLNNTTNITLSLTATSISSSAGRLITSSQLNAFKTAWEGLCSGRSYYGNINNSTAKNAFSIPNKGTKASATQMNSILNTYNKYFTSITVVNTGNLIQETTYDTLVAKVMSNPSCKVACTGFCTATNSHAPVPATCSSCDTGCSSSCYDSCQSTCYGRCSTGCKGDCAWWCDGTCWDSCKDECGMACEWDCEGYIGQWPSRDCGSLCNSDCGSKCGGACWHLCWSCEGSCYYGCYDSCEVWCDWDCSGGCSGGCDSNCSGYCDYTCSATCAGDTSGSAGACNNSCTHNCATNCNTFCVTSSS